MKAKFPYHGWHWWFGKAPEFDCNGEPVGARWYCIHVWTEGGCHYALSAHWKHPMDCQRMGGQWGNEIRRIENSAFIEALEPFAKFACDIQDGESCDCHNCKARDVITKAKGGSL
jgi:hypothetical protein